MFYSPKGKIWADLQIPSSFFSNLLHLCPKQLNILKAKSDIDNFVDSPPLNLKKI